MSDTLALFDMEPEPVKPTGDQWVRSGPACGGIWTHSTGAVVRHCGHPTALYPYWGILPDGTEPCIDFPERFLNKNKPAYRAVPRFAELKACQAFILKEALKAAK